MLLAILLHEGASSAPLMPLLSHLYWALEFKDDDIFARQPVLVVKVPRVANDGISLGNKCTHRDY
jgi:hypothetical protein